VHVFGPVARFPYAAGLRAKPLDAPKEALFALHRRMGIERCVIVQSIVHGTDNRVVEDAIAAGEGRYLGIALVEPEIPDAELQRLAQLGFRGVRFNFMRHIAHRASIDTVMAFTSRLAAVGMHLQVHFESALVHELSGPLQRSQVPVVIDHMGRVDATRGPDHEDFQALLRLLDSPRFYVKVSGIDRIDAKAPPQERYRHGVVLARALVERFPAASGGRTGRIPTTPTFRTMAFWSMRSRKLRPATRCLNSCSFGIRKRFINFRLPDRALLLRRHGAGNALDGAPGLAAAVRQLGRPMAYARWQDLL
jgi:2-pyrone-4,6-dicarboxylate lactonase